MSIALQEFSDAGRNMLGRANNGETLTFTTMVIGAGVAANAPALWPLTALIDHRFNVNIIAQIDQGDGVLILDGVINSADIPTGQGFNLNELGLMAHIAAEPDQLYCVANTFDDTLADFIPDVDTNPTAVHAFKVKVIIDRATNVTVVIGTSADILATNIGAATVGAGVFAQKIANTLQFKRLVMGPNIEIEEDDDTITIGFQVLTVSVDLYVSNTGLGHPDNNTSLPDFLTVADAMAYLRPIHIPAHLNAHIHIDAGSYDQISINHPDGARINVTGAPTVDYNITGFFQRTGAVGAWFYTLSFGATANIAGLNVGDGVYLTGVTGTGDLNALNTLCSDITAIDAPNGRVTVRTLAYSDWYAGAGGAPIVTGGILRKVPTIIRHTGTTTGIGSGYSQTGLMSNLFIWGSGPVGTTGGVQTDGGRIRIGPNICIFQQAIAMQAFSNSLIDANNVYISWCYDGIFANGGQIQARNAKINGNQNTGAYASSGGFISITGDTALLTARIYGVWNYGIYAVDNATITAIFAVVINGSREGILSENGSWVQAQFSNCQGNGQFVDGAGGTTYDYHARTVGSMRISNRPAGVGTAFPVPNTAPVGGPNGGSIIIE
jgi:hypothetical protein